MFVWFLLPALLLVHTSKSCSLQNFYPDLKQSFVPLLVHICPNRRLLLRQNNLSPARRTVKLVIIDLMCHSLVQELCLSVYFGQLGFTISYLQLTCHMYFQPFLNYVVHSVLILIQTCKFHPFPMSRHDVPGQIARFCFPCIRTSGLLSPFDLADDSASIGSAVMSVIMDSSSCLLVVAFNWASHARIFCPSSGCTFRAVFVPVSSSLKNPTS